MRHSESILRNLAEPSADTWFARPPPRRNWYAAPDSGTLFAMKPNLVADILELPVAERVRLVEAIWDSIAAAPEGLTLTEWQREELDRSLAEFDADPDSGSTLDDVFSRIRRS